MGSMKTSHLPMESEWEESLPFLEILVYWRNDGTLGNKVYRKPYTSSCLPKTVLSTLVNRVKTLSDSMHLIEKMEMLRTTLLQNDYACGGGYPSPAYTSKEKRFGS